MNTTMYECNLGCMYGVDNVLVHLDGLGLTSLTLSLARVTLVSREATLETMEEVREEVTKGGT